MKFSTITFQFQSCSKTRGSAVRRSAGRYGAIARRSPSSRGARGAAAGSKLAKIQPSKSSTRSSGSRQAARSKPSVRSISGAARSRPSSP
jgi:hypothetical protein